MSLTFRKMTADDFPACAEELIAAADTTWALVDLNNKQLRRVDSLDLGFEHEAPIDIGIPPRFRVPKTEELQLIGERKIVYSDLDYNMHMNNTRYPDMLCDFLPTDEIGRIRGIFLSLAGGIFCVIVAFLDEYSQSFVFGRTPAFRDVLIDSAGAFCGILVAQLLCYLGRKTIFHFLSMDEYRKKKREYEIIHAYEELQKEKQKDTLLQEKPQISNNK